MLTVDILLFLFAFIAAIIGVVGCILPVLPGPSLVWLALLLANATEAISFSTQFLLITAVITIVITVLDFIFPSLAVKRKGGTKMGQVGSILGAIIGMFFGIIGIIIGPFIGTFLGELLFSKNDFQTTLNIAFSSFVGFLLSTGVKLIWSLMMLFWLIKSFF